MTYTFPLRSSRHVPAPIRPTVFAAPRNARLAEHATRAEGERRLRARIEAGWYGWPSRFGPAQLLVDLGLGFLSAVEKLFIRPTTTKGSDRR